MTVRQLIQFLKPLEDDFKCPICFEILQEPHLTTCCGNHHLCKGCMENIKEANGGCPFCQKKPFTGFIDKRFERQLNELKVYCIYKPKGCDWIGNFGKIEQHLSIDEQNGECQFVAVKCPVSVECEEYIFRKYLKNHINNICKYRRAQCLYCEFVSTYQKITTLHITKCTKYPLLCPNKCSDQTYPRDQLSTHLASCPEQEVDCTFSEMGCEEKIKRRLLQEHLDTNILQHQLIMCQAFKEMKKDKQEVEKQLELLKRDKKELENKIQDMLKFSNQEDKQIKSLKFIAIKKYQSLYFPKMAELSDINPVAPLVLKASFQINREDQYNAGNYYTAQPFYDQYDVEDHYAPQPYKSPFFYSYPNGYKLQLSAKVVCHCSNCVKPPQEVVQPQYIWSRQSRFGPKPSLSVDLYIFKGEHDSQLKWPFKEKVTITTIRENDNHSSVENIFVGNRNHTNNGIKLGIKSLPTKPPMPLNSLPLHQLQVPIIPTDEDQLNFSLPEYNMPQRAAAGYSLLGYNMFQQPGYRQPEYCQQTEPVDTRNVQNDIVFFEVTFSPQPVH